MIGSQELAREVLSMSDYDHPTEWSFLGNGTYRNAFRGPDGFVYKRNLYNGQSRFIGYNHVEFDTFTKLKERGFLWVPQFAAYSVNDEVIMVVQYLRDATYRDWSRHDNDARYQELDRLVADSGEENTGIDPETGLVFLRDGGNGLRFPGY